MTMRFPMHHLGQSGLWPRKKQISVLEHQPYWPDLATCDFRVSGTKNLLETRSFSVTKT